MATRELAEIKDKNGDVNELRDKKLADSIAKNTVVNTDNVRMVDTNGKEVFIARDSFISAIRNVLGGFILSNTKAEAPNIPVFDSNGDFGAITAANLASVLGVEPSSILTSSTKIKYVNFVQGRSAGRIIAPFKLINGGQSEGCLFPIFTNGDPGLGSGIGISLVYMENYTVGGQNNHIYNSGVTWTFDGQESDGRAKLRITSSGAFWTFFIPFIIWTSGPHWTQYYDMDFEVY